MIQSGSLGESLISVLSFSLHGPNGNNNKSNNHHLDDHSIFQHITIIIHMKSPFSFCLSLCVFFFMLSSSSPSFWSRCPEMIIMWVLLSASFHSFVLPEDDHLFLFSLLTGNSRLSLSPLLLLIHLNDDVGGEMRIPFLFFLIEGHEERIRWIQERVVEWKGEMKRGSINRTKLFVVILMIQVSGWWWWRVGVNSVRDRIQVVAHPVEDVDRKEYAMRECIIHRIVI